MVKKKFARLNGVVFKTCLTTKAMDNVVLVFTVATVLCVLLGVHLDQIRPICQRYVRLDDVPFASGDLLLFHSSVFLSLLLGSSWTHVGVVVEEDNHLYLWEIRPPFAYPVKTPLLESLQQRLPLQRIVWRAIRQPIPMQIESFLHVRYNFHSWMDILASWLSSPLILPLPRQQGKLHACCVDLIRETLIQSGISLSSTMLTPVDFSSTRPYTEQWETERQLVYTNTQSTRFLRHHF